MITVTGIVIYSTLFPSSTSCKVLSVHKSHLAEFHAWFDECSTSNLLLLLLATQRTSTIEIEIVKVEVGMEVRCLPSCNTFCIAYAINPQARTFVRSCCGCCCCCVSVLILFVGFIRGWAITRPQERKTTVRRSPSLVFPPPTDHQPQPCHRGSWYA